MAEEKTPQEANEQEPVDEVQETVDDDEAQQADEDESSQEQEEPLSQEEILQQELKACEEKYVRVHAEFENIKRRLEKEKYQAIEYASEKFAKDLIPVVDSLGKAIESAQSDADSEALLKSLSEGVELTFKQLMSTLEKNGVKEIEATGELDPNVHEAVMRVDSQAHESGQIVDVMQKGYVYKDRTLRATMVSVAN